MEVITATSRAGTASRRWDDVYLKEPWVSDPKMAHMAAIGDKLRALGPDAKKEDVDAIIGNRSWTEFPCDHCGDYHEVGVQFDHAFEDEQSMTLCAKCLFTAEQVARFRCAS